MNKSWPEEDDLIVGTVTKVFPYGAFVKLEGFDVDGMIHISEISPKWIKNISDFVQVGKRVVVQVLKVDSDKGHIDLSMKRLSENLVREKIKEWKNEERAKRLITITGQRLKLPEEDAKKIISLFEEKFNSIYLGFEDAREDKKFLKDNGIPSPWDDELTKIAMENIESSEISIVGFVELKSKKENGVKDITSALLSVKDAEIQYAGSPYYRIKIKGTDYKLLEKTLKEKASKIIETLEKAGGEGIFHRELKV